jgi:hypothetical protein
MARQQSRSVVGVESSESRLREASVSHLALPSAGENAGGGAG